MTLTGGSTEPDIQNKKTTVGRRVPAAPAPSSSRGPWIAGVAALALVVIGVGVAVATGTSSDSDKSPVLSKTFLAVDKECELVTKAMLDVYVPGASCASQAFSGMNNKDGVSTYAPSWAVESATRPPTQIELGLTLTPAAEKLFTDSYDDAVRSFEASHHDPQIGEITLPQFDKAYLMSGSYAYAVIPQSDARVAARKGNAVVILTFKGFGSIDDSVGAVKAIAADIITHLPS
ncbi:hypothetical protein ABZ319_10760 [Nocardia sp. NPDC005978]|uniref:hypothetical protein n=1 Tax=Nocardia sp. NPDC005978 TaxID=3156725 RepID=UPI0033B4C767